MAAKKIYGDYEEPSAQNVEGRAEPARKRSPVKAVVTFDLLDEAGNSVQLPTGHRVVVRNVERDLVKFAEAVLDNPSSVGLFAKIEVPYAG